MPDLLDMVKKLKKETSKPEPFIESKSSKEVISDSKKTLSVKKIELEKIESKSNIVGHKIDEITIDEARAYYIVICKKKPKHNSIQTKNFLINEIIEILEQSKSKKAKKS